MRQILLSFLLALPISGWAFDAREAVVAYENALAETKMRHGLCGPGGQVLRKGQVDMIVATGEVPREIAVAVDDKSGPLHLFLYSSETRHWRLSGAQVSDIRSITVFGRGKAMVSGFAEETDIFTMTTNARGNRLEPCETGPEADQRLALVLHHFSMSQLTFPDLEFWLKEATGKRLSALIMMEWGGSQTQVGWLAREETARLRETGLRLLEALRPPVPMDATAGVARLPVGLSGDGITGWLIETGAAVPVTNDLVDFLCLRERAVLTALGFQPFHAPMACKAREQYPLERQFVLVRSLDIGDYYECNHDRGPILHVPQGLAVTGQFTNCNVAVFPM